MKLTCALTIVTALLATIVLGAPTDPFEVKPAAAKLPDKPTLYEHAVAWDAQSKFVDFDEEKRAKAGHPLVFTDFLFEMTDPDSSIDSTVAILKMLDNVGRKKQVVFVVQRARVAAVKVNGKVIPQRVILLRMAEYPAWQRKD